LAKQNALETYRRILRLQLIICLMVALVLILVGISYFLAAKP
jgi:hypothetical protein